MLLYYSIPEMELKEFRSWNEFVKWKEAEEEATHTCYVKPKGDIVFEDVLGQEKG